MTGNNYPDLLPRMAQFELTLLDWAENHRGARKYVAFADKCWPAFPEQFGFEPCYVNSRLAARGIPVACEVDIYGALSEYIGACVTGDAVTLLDINNSVPKALYDEDIAGKFPYVLRDTFMGFHCGNTPACKMCASPGGEVSADPEPPAGKRRHARFHPRHTGRRHCRLSHHLLPAAMRFQRGSFRSSIAQGEVLPVATRSFGGIGIFAIHEMDRFYRHVLLAKRYPHHGAVAFAHCGKTMYEVFRYLGWRIAYNQPASSCIPGENPPANSRAWEAQDRS